MWDLYGGECKIMRLWFSHNLSEINMEMATCVRLMKVKYFVLEFDFSPCRERNRHKTLIHQDKYFQVMACTFF